MALIVGFRSEGNFNKRALNGVFAAYRVLVVIFFSAVLYHVAISCYYYIVSGAVETSEKHLTKAFEMLKRPQVILVFVLIEFVFSNIQRVIDALRGNQYPTGP